MTTRVDDAPAAEPFDDALRWIIASDTNPHESYVVELHSPPGFSVCQCKHFECRLGPLLARQVSPEEAVASGAVKLKEGARIEDALKCKHILDAEKRLARSVVKAMETAQKRNRR